MAGLRWRRQWATGRARRSKGPVTERERDAETKFASLANSTLRLSGFSNQHPWTPDSARPYMPVPAGGRGQCELEKVIGRWVFVSINKDNEYSRHAVQGAHIGLRI